MKKAFVLILAFLLILPGCQQSSDDYSGFRIYYLSENGRNLQESYCGVDSDETSTAWLDEMKDKLNNGTAVPAQGKALLTEDTQITGIVNNSGVITVDIQKGYYDLSAAQQLLVRAGITNTFIQSSAVKAVMLNVNGKPAVDPAGNELAVMTANTFVDENSDGINNYRSSAMTLYFTNETGTELIAENRTAYYSVNTPIEQAVMNELIRGPINSGHYRTLPQELNVLNVTIQDDICYVNLDESFTNSVFVMDPQIQIYSIVNSIAAVCGVENVAFSINGSSSVVFKDQIDLDQIFTPSVSAN